MQERRAPQVSVHGQPAAGPVADVIGSGSDEERPAGRRRGTVAAGLAALVLAGVAVAQQGEESAPATPEPADLALVETGGSLTAQWGYGGRLDVSLPLHIRNDGGPMTIASVSLEGTRLSQPAVDVAVVPGGRLPVTLRQTMACPGAATVPADAVLRLDVVRDGLPATRVLPLPEGAAADLAVALRAQCAAVPLDQAVVLTSAEVEQRGDAVELRVQASNLAVDAVQLMAVEPATGLRVTLAPDPESLAVGLPTVLAREPVVFRLLVSVADCAAAAARDLEGTFAVADVVYDDGRGNRAGKAVTGHLPLLRDLMEKGC